MRELLAKYFESRQQLIPLLERAINHRLLHSGRRLLRWHPRDDVERRLWSRLESGHWQVVNNEVHGFMTPAETQQKCKQLLACRDSPETAWYYVVRDWRRQLLFCIAYLGVAAGLWFLECHLVSVAFLAFYVGRSVRDLRRWKALAREWPSTKELLDWPRIESIAANDNEEGRCRKRGTVMEKPPIFLVGGSRWIADIQRLAGVAKHWFLADIADGEVADLTLPFHAPVPKDSAGSLLRAGVSQWCSLTGYPACSGQWSAF